MSREKSLQLHNVKVNEGENVINDTSHSLELQQEDVATNSEECPKEKEIEKTPISKSKLKKLRKIQRWEETKSMKRFGAWFQTKMCFPVYKQYGICTPTGASARTQDGGGYGFHQGHIYVPICLSTGVNSGLQIVFQKEIVLNIFLLGTWGLSSQERFLNQTALNVRKCPFTR